MPIQSLDFFIGIFRLFRILAKFRKIFSIITEHHKLRKVVVRRWVPNELTDEDRMKRVEDYSENSKLFLEGMGRLCDVFTGDE